MEGIIYQTLRGKKAQIVKRDSTATIYIYEGYIYAKNEKIIKTAWDAKGNNIFCKKWNIKIKRNLSNVTFFFQGPI
jgi:hypothetical protein